MLFSEDFLRQSGEVLLFYSQKTMMSYAIKAAKESINLEKESIIEKIKEYKQDSDSFNKKRQSTKDYYKNQER